MVAELQNKYAVGTFYQLGVQQDQKDSSSQIVNASQGGLTLPDRSYYIDDSPRSQKLRDQYVEHVTKMFVLVGDSPDKAAEEAKSVMSIETALAKGSIDRVELRDPAKRYHIMTLAELQALSPAYNWDAYVKGIKIGEFKTLNVATPDLLHSDECGDRFGECGLDQELSAVACAAVCRACAVEAVRR